MGIEFLARTQHILEVFRKNCNPENSQKFHDFHGAVSGRADVAVPHL